MNKRNRHRKFMVGNLLIPAAIALGMSGLFISCFLCIAFWVWYIVDIGILKRVHGGCHIVSSK